MNELLLSWLKTRKMSITVHMIPTTHHFIFLATSKTVVSLMNQCVATISAITTETFIILRVGNIAAPEDKPNMEDNNLQAVVKSAERKNTQVTFTRKNVSNARKKFCEAFVRKNAGAKEDDLTGTGTTSGNGKSPLDSFFRNNLSTQR